MPLKHRIKLGVRNAYSRVLFHTGLHRLVDRLMPVRLTILAGHCVADEGSNGGLPPDMKIPAERLERLLGFLARRYDACTVSEGVRRLDADAKRSMIALSMDDGYRDNATVLPELLERTGARATVFLESRPLDERRVSWTHQVFWLLGRMDARALAERYMALASDAGTEERLRGVLAEGGDLAYGVKRVLKYDAPIAEREHVIERLFAEEGGDERALCDRVYMTWDDARRLRDSGVELGGHTEHHFILSRLDAEEAAGEVERGRAALARELGEEATRTFAYPFGRNWDFDANSVAAVRRSGFAAAVTTHAGTNTKGRDRMRLARWMIDEATPLHLLATEACGGFELLRKLGVDLSE